MSVRLTTEAVTRTLRVSINLAVSLVYATRISSVTDSAATVSRPRLCFSLAFIILYANL